MSVCECYLPVVCECVRQSTMKILIEPIVFHGMAAAIVNHDQFVVVDADNVRYYRVSTYSMMDIWYKVMRIGKIAKHKGIGETKILRNFSFIEIPVSELKRAN